MTAVYFSFITLSTIGFGDETPTNTFHAISDPNANFGDTMKVVVAILYCSLGLAILSLCVSLIQEQISLKAARVLHGKEEKVVMDQVAVIERKANVMDGKETLMYSTSHCCFKIKINLELKSIKYDTI